MNIFVPHCTLSLQLTPKTLCSITFVNYSTGDWLSKSVSSIAHFTPLTFPLAHIQPALKREKVHFFLPLLPKPWSSATLIFPHISFLPISHLAPLQHMQNNTRKTVSPPPPILDHSGFLLIKLLHWQLLSPGAGSRPSLPPKHNPTSSVHSGLWSSSSQSFPHALQAFLLTVL